MPKWFIDLGIVCLTIMMVSFLMLVTFVVVAVGYDIMKEWRRKRGKDK